MHLSLRGNNCYVSHVARIMILINTRQFQLITLPDADVIIFSIDNTHSIAGQSECHDVVMTGTWMSGYIIESSVMYFKYK